MKTKTLFLSLCLCAASALGQVQDIRMVGTASVNLTPIHVWERKHEGERPMKHWKDIQMLEFKGHVATWAKCRITVDGVEQEVLLANAEKAEAFLTGLTNLTQRVEFVSNWIEQAQRGLRTAQARAENINMNTSAYAYVPQSWYNNVDDARDALRHTQADLLKMQMQVPQMTHDLAMYTGKNYSSLQIWDLGKRKQ